MNGNSFKTMYVISKQDKEALENNSIFKLNVENDNICKDGLNISVKPVKQRSKKVQFDTSKRNDGNDDGNNNDEDGKNMEIVDDHEKNSERYSEIPDLEKDTDYDEIQMLDRLNKLRYDYDYPQQPPASAIPFQNLASRLPSINYASFEDLGNKDLEKKKNRSPNFKVKQSSLSQFRFSPYSRRQPSLNEKISQQRNDEINRLSHIRQQSHETYPETLTEEDNAGVDVDQI